MACETIPTGVTATGLDDDRVEVSWSADPLDGLILLESGDAVLLEDGGYSFLETGYALVGYKIYRDSVLVETTVTPSTFTYTDVGLEPATTYDYYVVAYEDDCDGDPSAIDSATTATLAPSGISLSQTPDATGIIITWTDPSGTEGIIVEGDGSQIADVTPGTQTYTDSLYTPDVERCYRLYSYLTDAPDSAYSSEECATVPAAPTDLTASEI